jgi:hypothetical protein
MMQFFNKLIGIPLIYLGNACFYAAYLLLGGEYMEHMGCLRKDDDHAP